MAKGKGVTQPPKFEFPGEYSFMTGSGGQADYLIIARKGKYLLGIKPVLEMVGFATMVCGMRIRAAGDPNFDGPEQVQQSFENVVTVDFTHDAKGSESDNEFAQAFPGIAFANKSLTRASTMFGLIFKPSKVPPTTLKEKLEGGYFSQIVEKLESRLGEDRKFKTVSAEEVEAYLAHILKPKIDENVATQLANEQASKALSAGLDKFGDDSDDEDETENEREDEDEES